MFTSIIIPRDDISKRVLLQQLPLPTSGTAVLWKHRAIYRIRDAQIGHWSQVLEVGVKR